MNSVSAERNDTTRPVIFFDFFGTLVDYSPSRTEMGFQATFQYLKRLGYTLSYDEFVKTWEAKFAEFDARSDIDDSEFTMRDVASSYLSEFTATNASDPTVSEFVDQYLLEWNRAAIYPDGLNQMLTLLATKYRLAVVTNTHQADLVPKHLKAMGAAPLFEAVVTSAEVGWRKPHEAMYLQALAQLNTSAGTSIFVGDSLAPDFDGPQAQGMVAYLIDPVARYEIPSDRRLSTLFDLPDRLGIKVGPSVRHST